MRLEDSPRIYDDEQVKVTFLLPDKRERKQDRVGKRERKKTVDVERQSERQQDRWRRRKIDSEMKGSKRKSQSEMKKGEERHIHTRAGRR